MENSLQHSQDKSAYHHCHNRTEHPQYPVATPMYTDPLPMTYQHTGLYLMSPPNSVGHAADLFLKAGVGAN